jgi:hypothetical protein
MKTRFYIIVGIIIVCVVAAIAFSASTAPSTKKVKDSDTITVTILNNIGIDRIVIMNQNTRDKITLTIIDLPYQFNCTRGQRISATITSTDGFQWNTMKFNGIGTFDDGVTKNGVSVVSFVADGDLVHDNQIVLNPCFTDLEVSPTVSPSPSPSPTPIE